MMASGGEQTTDSAGLDERTDSSLSTLVPQSSSVRSLAVTGVLLALLVGAFFAPSLLRPEIGAFGGSGSLAYYPDVRQVVTTMHLTPEGRDSTIVDVEALPGTRVVDAWVLDSGYAEMVEDTDEALNTDPIQALAERFPGQDFSTAMLPQRIGESGSPRELVILWEIIDCSQLDSAAQPTLSLRTAIGLTIRQPVDESLNPSSWHGVDGLAEEGLCEEPGR